MSTGVFDKAWFRDVFLLNESVVVAEYIPVSLLSDQVVDLDAAFGLLHLIAVLLKSDKLIDAVVGVVWFMGSQNNSGLLL